MTRIHEQLKRLVNYVSVVFIIYSVEPESETIIIEGTSYTYDYGYEGTVAVLASMAFSTIGTIASSVTGGTLFIIINRGGKIHLEKKLKRIHFIIMMLIVAIGIGLFILVQVVARNGLTPWQEPITTIVQIYVLLPAVFTLLFYVILKTWKYFDKKSK